MKIKTCSKFDEFLLIKYSKTWVTNMAQQMNMDLHHFSNLWTAMEENKTQKELRKITLPSYWLPSKKNNKKSHSFSFLSYSLPSRLPSFFFPFSSHSRIPLTASFLFFLPFTPFSPPLFFPFMAIYSPTWRAWLLYITGSSMEEAWVLHACGKKQQILALVGATWARIGCDKHGCVCGSRKSCWSGAWAMGHCWLRWIVVGAVTVCVEVGAVVCLLVGACGVGRDVKWVAARLIEKFIGLGPQYF